VLQERIVVAGKGVPRVGRDAGDAGENVELDDVRLVWCAARPVARAVSSLVDQPVAVDDAARTASLDLASFDFLKYVEDDGKQVKVSCKK
jgi:hypothetical protein